MGGRIGSGPIPKTGPPNSKVLEEKMQQYKNNLPPEEKEIKTILRQRNEIEDALKNDLDIVEVRIIGSYARETMIASKEGNDIDVIFVLNENNHGQWLEQENGPTNCLLAVKQTLEKDPRFKDSNIKIDRNVVAVSNKNYKIDVIPAYRHENGGYKIPDTYEGQKWIQTEPRKFKRVMESVNKQHNGRVSEVVKVVKGWNEANGKKLNSYHIETMVINYYKDQPKNNTSLNEDVRSVFRELPWMIRGRTSDIIISSNRIDSYLSPSKKSEASIKAQRANKNLDEAANLYDKGKDKQADKKLKQAFGKKMD